MNEQRPVDAEQIPPSAWRTLFTVSLIGFMVSLEITVIALAFPSLRDAFPTTTESTLSWVVTAYNIGVASLLLVSGWASDRYGRKKLFLAGVLLFVAGSILAGVSWSASVLIIARLVQSVGGAMQYPAGLALVLSAFPPARRQMAVGIWGAVGALAAAVGPTIGGVLLVISSWRSVFLVNVPVATLALVAGHVWLVEGKGQAPEKVDRFSVPAASLGVAGLVLLITYGDQWGPLTAPFLATSVIAVGLLTFFVFRSRSHPQPLFDLDLFKLRSYSVATVGNLLFGAAFFGWLLTLPSFMLDTWNWSPLQVGLGLAPGPLVAMVTSPIFGRAADRIGNKPILTMAGVCGAIGMVLFVLLTTVEPNYVVGLLLPGTFIGLAAGGSFAQLVGAAMRDVPPQQFGSAGAGRQTVFQLSVALGVATALAIVGRPEAGQPALEALQRLWVFTLVLYVGQALLFGLVFPNKAD